MKFLIKAILGFVIGCLLREAGLTVDDWEAISIMAIYAIGASL